MKRCRNQRAVAGNSLRLGAEAVERSRRRPGKVSPRTGCSVCSEMRETKQRHAVRGAAAVDNQRTTTHNLSLRTVTDRPALLVMTAVALVARSTRAYSNCSWHHTALRKPFITSCQYARKQQSRPKLPSRPGSPPRRLLGNLAPRCTLRSEGLRGGCETASHQREFLPGHSLESCVPRGLHSPNEQRRQAVLARSAILRNTFRLQNGEQRQQ